MIVNPDDNETFEVTCPFCGAYREFNSISGNDGAGQWLIQHREFHGYEMHQATLQISFDDSSSNEDDNR